MTKARLRVVSSINAPPGVVMIMPVVPPMVMTVPIRPLSPLCASRNTPRKGPIPACMSAIATAGATCLSRARLEVGPSGAPIAPADGPQEKLALEFRYQRDPGDHQCRARDTAAAEIVHFHAEQSVPADHQRHQVVRRDGQASEGAGADLADEKQLDDHGEGTDEAFQEEPIRASMQGPWLWEAA
jgi:hypothetical protein